MTAILAAFGTEAALRQALARLRSADFDELETFSPLPLKDVLAKDELATEASTWLPTVVLSAGVAGAAFILGLETLSTVSSWGYPVDIGGRPAFSWPAYIPIAVAFGILTAALGGLAAYAVASAAWRLWDAVDEFEAMPGASRDRWIVHVEFEEEHLIDKAYLALSPLRPLSIRVLSHDVEEVPA